MIAANCDQAEVNRQYINWKTWNEVSMAIITRFIEVDSVTLGVETSSVIGQTANKLSGYIKQIMARVDSGNPTSINVQLRYISGISEVENLVYDYTDGILPFIDCLIDAPFSLRSPTIASDLILYVSTDTACTLQFRIDIDVDMTKAV